VYPEAAPRSGSVLFSSLYYPAAPFPPHLSAQNELRWGGRGNHVTQIVIIDTEPTRSSHLCLCINMKPLSPTVSALVVVVCLSVWRGRGRGRSDAGEVSRPSELTNKQRPGRHTVPYTTPGR
jgi:hypothetical protein